MALVEGIGDDVTVVFLLFTGVVTLLLWKICFRSVGISYDETTVERERELRGQSMNFDTLRSRDEPGSQRGINTEEANDEENNENARISGEMPDNDGTGTILIKLRHGETEQMTRVRSDQTVGELKRMVFASELASGHRVRFVYQGRLLQYEDQPLSFYNLCNNSVIIVAITGPGGSGSPERLQTAEFESPEFDMSQFFFPLVSIIVVVIWIVGLSNPGFFSTAAWLMLIIMTAGFCFLFYNSHHQLQTRQ